MLLILAMLYLDIKWIYIHWNYIKGSIIKAWRIIKPFLTWRILICYLPFWFLATGWAWLFSFIGHGVIRAVAIAWLGFLWMPWCPEKLITIPAAIWLHKKLFPKHSTAHLDNMLQKEKEKIKK